MSISPCRTTLRKPSALKRPLSPEPAAEVADHSSKRARTAQAVVVEQSPTPAVSRAEAKKEKERRREKDRLAREEEFRIKYTRAFPSWVFYFDLDTGNPEIAATKAHLEKRLAYMGARIEDFFSKDITHFITLHDVDDKENAEKDTAKGAAQPSGLLGSPIRLRGRAMAGHPTAASLVQKARSFNMKLWSAEKLGNILDRCQAPRVSSTTGSLPARAQQVPKDRNLARLLETERLHGTTERDPTQRRHDYVYFSKESYFVLVEDLRQELATIAAAEYPITKNRDGSERGAWPVPHCHPLSRGPFLRYDEREERRRQKAEKSEQDRKAEKARRKARLQQSERKRRAQMHARIQAAQQQHDLRRSASMNNLQRRATFPAPGMEGGFVDLDADYGECDPMESANASGYLASAAYMAASGNSVGITSTTGTTSTAGAPFRTLQLPPALKEKLQQQVTTSRRASIAAPILQRDNKENVMGPPTTIPERAKFLRKSKSTNTLKLPKRDEATKPGYCECCRVKFEDFSNHVVSRKHRKYAGDDAHFENLDRVLARVRRRTVQEVEEENARFIEEAQALALAMPSSEGEDSQALMQQVGDASYGDDVKWDDWVDAGNCAIEV
ncbi:Hsk1-interacting molecule 1 [Trametes pubescens]|uniref:Hsk1-interacting molecule 1 n=1 Tax=Trametes pubescens TaxID=154538 RepID=A0A1M2VTC6_TRAPU|nr:Hsk1-interacting molecule 1 [Trametes pubescens]